MAKEKQMPTLMNVTEISRQTGWSRPRIYDFAARPDDPLPLRKVNGTERGFVVVVSDFLAWLDRNTTMYAEKE